MKPTENVCPICEYELYLHSRSDAISCLQKIITNTKKNQIKNEIYFATKEKK